MEESTKKCPMCAEEVGLGDEVCKYCGALLTESVVAEQAKKPEPVPESPGAVAPPKAVPGVRRSMTPEQMARSKKRGRIVLIVFLLFIVVIGGTLAIVYFTMNSTSHQLDQLKSKDSKARISAAKKLGEKKAKSAVQPLVNLLQDPDSEVRAAAYEALGFIGDPAATEPIVNRLGGENAADATVQSARSAAVNALVKLKDARSIGVLISCLDDPNLGTRAQDALVAIGAPAFPTLMAAGKWKVLAEMEKAHPGSTAPLPSYLDSNDLKNIATYYEYFVQLNRPGSEGVLISALNAYSNDAMIDYYLNCDIDSIEDATVDWCTSHGYVVVPKGSQ